MGQAIAVEVELTQISCGVCGGVYAINERVRQHHEQRGTSWHCPYCETLWGYPKGGTLAAAERALAEEKDRHARTLARLNTEEKRARKFERKLQRVASGVCPECNRSFADLARHMACKHATPEAT